MSHLLMIESWVGGTGRILPQAIRAAGHRYTFVTRRLDHYAAGCDGTPHPVLAHAARVLTLETNDVAELERELRRQHAKDPFDGALGICDYYLDAIVQVATALGIPHPLPARVAAERRKHVVRRALDEAGVPNVRHALTHGWEATRDAARALGYPLVSKPTDLASSAHVRLVRDERELREALLALERFDRNFRDQPRDGHVLLEEFLEGPEVSVEACSVDGQTVVLGVTDKGVTGAPFFVEDSHMFPAALERDVVRTLDAYARQVLASVGHDRGFAHLEVKLTAAGPRLVELNPRLPGNYIVELVQRVTGVDLLAATIELALGGRPSLSVGAGSGRSAAIQFIMPPSGGVLRAVLGTESLARDPHLVRHELTAMPGSIVAEPVDNGCYLGHVVAVDREGLSARSWAEAAVRRLEVIVDGAPGPEAPTSLSELFDLARSGRLGEPSPRVATSAFWMCHTTRLAGSTTTYLNHYVLLRCGSSFGAASFAPGQIEPGYCAGASGLTLAELMAEDAALPVRVAALDAYLAELEPHRSARDAEPVPLPPGPPEVRARARDEAIADLLELRPGQRVALIGVVNPLIAAIEARGGRCLPCDFNLRVTQWNQPVAASMDEVLGEAEAVVATGMTLANGTFDRLLAHCRSRALPFVVYAQTGSAVARAFLGSGVTGLCAEPFPFSQFSAEPTTVYRYRSARPGARR